MKQLKCPNCQRWTSLIKNQCDHCELDLTEDPAVLKQRMAEESDNSMGFLRIEENDNWLTKLWKGPVIFAQMVFFAVISLVAAIASSTVH